MTSTQLALLLSLSVACGLVIGCDGSSGSTSTPVVAGPETPVVVDLGEPIEPDADAEPQPMSGDSGMLARPVGKLPASYRFVERSGAEMRFADLQGRFAVVDFIFTSCKGPCPRMADAMGALQTRLADVDDVVLLSVSVDPQTDTPDVLADYAESVKADDEKWLFARMPIGYVNQLTRNEFLLGDGGDPRAHSPRFVLVDRKGFGRAIYDPLEDSGWIEKVVKDLETLRAETP